MNRFTITRGNRFSLLPATESILNSDSFVTTWRTTGIYEVVTLPATGTNDITIDWGDLSGIEITTDFSPSHTYAVAGDYDIIINGTISEWNHNNDISAKYLVDIKQWGNNVWYNLAQAFYGCINLVGTYTDVPNTTNVTSMRNMFRSCNNFNGNVLFDTTSVTNMYGMFYNCSKFNKSVSNFDTTLVTDMRYMFYGCNIFNQSVSNFTTSLVTSMREMFERCYAFNQSVSSFNTSLVNNMFSMFNGCHVFNQSVSNFNTANVTDMKYMFNDCYAFNQSVSNFDTGKVTDMYQMFDNCTLFNQDISGWDISLMTNAGYMLRDTAFDTNNYNLLLVAWEGKTHNNNVAFHAGNAKYITGAPTTARGVLTATDGWLITDGGQDAESFVTTWRTTTDAETVTLPANGVNDFAIDWGDGTVEQITSTYPSHEYATAGDYDVKILGFCPTWNQGNVGDKLKLRDIKQWGNNVWYALSGAFYGCTNLTGTYTDIPNTTNITTMKRMFYNCYNFNGKIEFDTSNVINMDRMLASCVTFNQSVSNFDTSSVTNMTALFASCLVFNQDISSFDITSLTDASYLLSSSAFSQINYDKLLVAWQGKTHNNNVPFHAGSAKYSSGAPATARATLVSDGWIITDGGAE